MVFQPGVSGNPSGKPSQGEQRARLLAKAAELAAPLGGYDALNAIERTLIEEAAALQLSKPKRNDERLRRANVTSRIMRDLIKRRGMNGKASAPAGGRLDAIKVSA